MDQTSRCRPGRRLDQAMCWQIWQWKRGGAMWRALKEATEARLRGSLSRYNHGVFLQPIGGQLTLVTSFRRLRLRQGTRRHTLRNILNVHSASILRSWQRGCPTCSVMLSVRHEPMLSPTFRPTIIPRPDWALNGRLTPIHRSAGTDVRPALVKRI